MVELLLVTIALTLGVGVALLYRLSTEVPAFREHIKSIQKVVETEMRKVRNYPDWRNPVFPLRSVRHCADLVVRYEEVLDKHEADLEEASHLESPSYLPRLEYEQSGKPVFADYKPTEEVKALMKNVLEARWNLSRALRDLDFIIEANMMVQRGELTISEAEGLQTRNAFDTTRYRPDGQALIAEAMAEWISHFTAEGQEWRTRQAEEWKYVPTPRQMEIDRLWGEKFKFKPNLGGIRFGIPRYYAVKLTD